MVGLIRFSVSQIIGAGVLGPDVIVEDQSIVLVNHVESFH
jgi:hypothetical protein